MRSHDLILGDGSRTLFVQSAGEGRDLVLIHGALTTHVDWLGGLFSQFARRGRVLAVDRPGHGQSRRLRFEGGPHQQARQIREGLAQLGVERPILVGHSFGGLVASAWASDYPQEVGGVVLVSPIAFPEFRLWEHARLGPRALPVIGPLLSQMTTRTTDPALMPLIQRIMFSPDAPPADWLARYPVGDILEAGHMVAEGEDALSILPGSPIALVNYAAIAAPVRIIAGAQDKVVSPNRHAKALAMLMPQAQLSMLWNDGHMIHHTAPETLFHVVDQLFVSLDGDQAGPVAGWRRKRA